MKRIPIRDRLDARRGFQPRPLRPHAIQYVPPRRLVRVQELPRRERPDPLPVAALRRFLQHKIRRRADVPFRRPCHSFRLRYNPKMTTAIYEPTIAKLQRLPEPLLQEVDAFIDFLQMRFESKAQAWHSQSDQSAHAEEGMDTYLRELESYEELLAAGKIKW